MILPIHYKFTGKYGMWDGDSGDEDRNSTLTWRSLSTEIESTNPLEKVKDDKYKSYLWMYVVFTYVFTAMGIYLLLQETSKIIRTRQAYLGTQTSTTDRTIRLSGIPPHLRSEEKIKEFIENLQIGKVEKVSICRNWRQLDHLMQERLKAVRKLEGAWTKHVGYRRGRKIPGTLPAAHFQLPRSDAVLDDADERTELLSVEDGGTSHIQSYENPRPTMRIWYGPFNFQSKKVDEIDYYEEKVRRFDEMIGNARQKEYPPTPLAFVTMESIAACQMAVQAILDPSPLQLLASLAPAPSDVVWQNTYLSRPQRMVRSWSITLLIGVLTIFWSVLLVPVAYLLNLEAINKVFPGFADMLADHPLAKSLVQTGLPTLLITVLTVIVPFLYNSKSLNPIPPLSSSPNGIFVGLANMQGMTSQGDVELSVISKNFFFTFFNLFLVFTVFGTASNFYGFWKNLRDAFKDTTTIIFALAQSLESLSQFYVNLIILQGLGLFPFRLLEFGAVALYPFRLMGSKTPRDHAELPNPPNFSYGLSLPHSILIFIICIVYSVFPSSWLVSLFGLIYFAMGSFIYKYQLLYAMDHQQHSTGRAWPMICSRVILGFVVFQLAMIGILAFRTAITRSILLVPLLAGTLWFSYFFSRTYEPLMKFIALRSIDRDMNGAAPSAATEATLSAHQSPSPPPRSTLSPPSGTDRDSVQVRIGSQSVAVLEKYVNPSLSQPLYAPWIPGHPRPNGFESGGDASGEGDDNYGGRVGV